MRPVLDNKCTNNLFIPATLTLPPRWPSRTAEAAAHPHRTGAVTKMKTSDAAPVWQWRWASPADAAGYVKPFILFEYGYKAIKDFGHRQPDAGDGGTGRRTAGGGCNDRTDRSVKAAQRYSQREYR